MSNFVATILCAAVLATGMPAATPSETGNTVRMTVTANVEKDKRFPQIERGDVIVKNGDSPLAVKDWAAAKGERAGLELFFVIDEASSSSLGGQLDDLRAFIQAQPETTAVGIAYARNGTVEVRQELTRDHAAAAKALRLPLSSAGAFGSPYLSVTDLMQRWRSSENRREVILITDGIDRAGRGHNALANPDIDTAAHMALKTGTMLHSIYFPGAGHRFHSLWYATMGQNGLAKLTDATGGESFFLGTQTPVSLAPYFEQLQRILDNQYLLTVTVQPGKKAGMQYVNVITEVAGVDFSAPGAVWVPAVQ